MDKLSPDDLPDLILSRDVAARMADGDPDAGDFSRALAWLCDARAVRQHCPGGGALLIWSLRDHERYCAMRPTERVAAYWAQAPSRQGRAGPAGVLARGIRQA